MTLVRRTGISVATCRPALLTPLLLLLSCAPGPDALHPPQVGRANASIRNGVIDTGHPAVVYLVGSGTCTGTLVAPTKVLTAAHCVERVGLGSVTFGPDTLGPSVLFHRAAIPPSWPADLGADIAVVTLDNPVLAVEPTRLQLAPLASSLVGRTVTLVGYGQTGPDGEGTGVKRKVDVTLGGMGPKTLSYSASANGGKSSDKGDSGGPALLDVDGEEVVVGVCSRGAFLNPDVGIYVRVDAWADWLRSQGVPVQSCADASGCPAPQKCLHGSCADPDVAPCNPDTFHAHDGCPSGQACTLEPGASGYERTCVAAGLLTEGVGAPCGPTARCQRGAVCRPGPSGSVCVPLCNRNLPNSCCDALAGQPVLGAKTCDAPIACSAPADCPAEAVLCEANRCVQCRADRDCPREQTCFLGWCASPFDGACAASADCFHKFCDTGSGRCAQCVRSRECPATAYCSGSVCAPYPAANCDPFLQTGCGSGKSCTRAPDSRAMSICAETGTGAALASCARAEDCGPRLACTSGICAPLCDAAHPCSRGDCIIFNGLGTCTVCRDDPDCPSGTRCDPQTSTCYECLSDAQCSGATPRCDPIRRRCAQRETPDAGCADADCGAEADAGTPPGVDDEVPPVEAPSGCGCGSGGSAPAGLALLAWWALAPRRVRRSSAPRITRRDTARAA